MKRVAVIGVGHFGREHARVYSAIEQAELVGVCDKDESQGRAVAAQFNAPFFQDYQRLLGQVDAVSLAVPTIDHCRVACEFLEAGVAVLVEKPMACSVAEADEMIERARRNKAVLQVGHLERFNPAVIAARRIVTRPMFFEAHRLSVFTPRSLDIDVVMDLMIHDLDVVLSLTGAEPAEVRAAGVAILTSRIDIANARIEFGDGSVANLTASRASGERVRKLRFFQPHEYVSIDYSSQEATVVTVCQPGAAIAGRTSESPGAGWPELKLKRLAVDHCEPLKAEIESFLASAEGAKVEVTGLDGRRALELAGTVTKRIREHALRAGVTSNAHDM